MMAISWVMACFWCRRFRLGRRGTHSANCAAVWKSTAQFLGMGLTCPLCTSLRQVPGMVHTVCRSCTLSTPVDTSVVAQRCPSCSLSKAADILVHCRSWQGCCRARQCYDRCIGPDSAENCPVSAGAFQEQVCNDSCFGPDSAEHCLEVYRCSSWTRLACPSCGNDRCSSWTRSLTCPLGCYDQRDGPDSAENCQEVVRCIEEQIVVYQHHRSWCIVEVIRLVRVTIEQIVAFSATDRGENV